MFRHRNKGRTFYHNVRLAALLSTVAGIVNIVGLLSFHTLTTNVTGHFAFFSEGLFLENFVFALISIIYVLCFLAGAFVGNTAMELTSKRRTRASYMLPISLEIMSLATVVLLHVVVKDVPLVLLGGLLLFAMGMQNALVTRISGAVVRTTHLTGLFTDLGIELSQLFFYKKPKERKRLFRSVFLRLIIIGGFFTGGIVGALFHQYYALWTLILPITLLGVALYYNRLRVNYLQIRRRWRRMRIQRTIR